MNPIPYGKQNIDEEDLEALKKVLFSPYLTQGPAIPEFETSFCKFTGAEHTIAVSNGTAALHLAFLALGISHGDGVIVPAITFAATSNAVLYCGGTPVFCDVDPETICMSVASAEEALNIAKKKGIKVRAIAPVHFAGFPCLTPELAEFARKHDLRIVEDACHALGAEYRFSEKAEWRKIGSSESDFVAFSFHPVKHICTGEGGALTTSNPKLAKQAAILRTHGITKAESDFVQLGEAHESPQSPVNPWYMEMQSLGYNYRLTDLQAALGTSQLKKLDKFVARRKEVASIYRKSFERHPKIKLQKGDTPLARHSYHLFPLLIDFNAANLTREHFFGKLKEKNIFPQVHYIPVYFHPYYRNNSHLWSKAECVHAERSYRSELSIPMYSNLGPEEVDYVISSISKIL